MEKLKAHLEDLFVGREQVRKKRKSTEKNEVSQILRYLFL